MTEIIFKNDLEQSKLDALIQFFKSWNIEVEIKKTKEKIKNKDSKSKLENQKDNFSFSTGIWKDYNIDSNELRKQAWNK